MTPITQLRGAPARRGPVRDSTPAAGPGALGRPSCYAPAPRSRVDRASQSAAGQAMHRSSAACCRRTPAATGGDALASGSLTAARCPRVAAPDNFDAEHNGKRAALIEVGAGGHAAVHGPMLWCRSLLHLHSTNAHPTLPPRSLPCSSMRPVSGSSGVLHAGLGVSVCPAASSATVLPVQPCPASAVHMLPVHLAQLPTACISCCTCSERHGCAHCKRRGLSIPMLAAHA